MKVKYRLLNDSLLYEDECITYLEKMAQDGWYLVKVGTTFFKFTLVENGDFFHFLVSFFIATP